MVAFALGFQQDDFRTPWLFWLRQDAGEWGFALEGVAFMDRIVQSQLLKSQKKWGKENFTVIRQVNAVFEGRIKSTVQDTFMTLTCCRTTEMKNRQHSEEKITRILWWEPRRLNANGMGNSRSPQENKSCWNMKIYWTDFLHACYHVFFFSVVPQWILSWLLAQKIKGRGKNVKQEQGAKAWNLSVFPDEEGEEVSLLSLQKMENISTGGGRSRLAKEFTVRSILPHFKHFE